MPIAVFLAASFVWFLILAQTINFITGFLILCLLSFVVFWKGFLTSRRAGELLGFKSRKQLFIFSLSLALGFSELIWAISFLPFSFFILGGLVTIISSIAFNIFKEYFKRYKGLFAEADENNFKRILTKNIILGAGLISVLILISPWLPPKTF